MKAAGWIIAGICALVALAAGGLVLRGRLVRPGQSSTLPATRPTRSPASAAPTFNRDIAPIVFNNCTTCHHPGEAVPFNLLNYADVKRRAKMISQVVQQRYMPPWMPNRAATHFVGERFLTDEQISLIRNWVEQGAPEGNPDDLTVQPQWTEGWQLGTPDLVVTMPESYAVPAEGGDIYRNFVVPIEGLKQPRWVRAVEMRPGSRSIVHHAFTMIDPTRSSRKLDQRDPGPGYGGMNAGEDVSTPPGQFLSWQPGKRASAGPPGLSWRLEPGADIILQVHIRPSGKAENLQAQVGLYFTDQPPTRNPTTLLLRSVAMDIPPGAKDYAIESSYVLPVDVQLTGLLPHTHYLGKQLMAWATLPDGQKKWLLLIEDWNFDWQGDYQFAEPVKLPAGTRLSMRYTFDNSAENPRNPNQPPQRVRYGLQSSDEMAELWLVALTRDDRDRQTLLADYLRNYGLPDGVAQASALVQRSPDDPDMRVQLGDALLRVQRAPEAIAQFEAALRIQPAIAAAEYGLGYAHAMQGDQSLAISHLESAVRLDPDHFKARNNLGFLYLNAGKSQQAEQQFREALRITPNDVPARLNLARVYFERADWGRSAEQLEQVLKIDPGNALARDFLARARANQSQR